MHVGQSQRVGGFHPKTRVDSLHLTSAEEKQLVAVQQVMFDMLIVSVSTYWHAQIPRCT